MVLAKVTESNRQEELPRNKRTHLDLESPHHHFLLCDQDEVAQSLCGPSCKAFVWAHEKMHTNAQIGAKNIKGAGEQPRAALRF